MHKCMQNHQLALYISFYKPPPNLMARIITPVSRCHGSRKGIPPASFPITNKYSKLPSSESETCGHISLVKSFMPAHKTEKILLGTQLQTV